MPFSFPFLVYQQRQQGKLKPHVLGHGFLALYFRINLKYAQILINNQKDTITTNDIRRHTWRAKQTNAFRVNVYYLFFAGCKIYLCCCIPSQPVKYCSNLMALFLTITDFHAEIRIWKKNICFSRSASRKSETTNTKFRYAGQVFWAVAKIRPNTDDPSGGGLGTSL